MEEQYIEITTKPTEIKLPRRKAKLRLVYVGFEKRIGKPVKIRVEVEWLDEKTSISSHNEPCTLNNSGTRMFYLVDKSFPKPPKANKLTVKLISSHDDADIIKTALESDTVTAQLCYKFI